MVSIDCLGWRTGANGELLEKEKYKCDVPGKYS